MSAIDRANHTGILTPSNRVVVEPGGRAGLAPEVEQNRRGAHGLAFAGLFLFTFLLYARPNEMFPQAFGSFPITRIVAVATLLAYFFSKLFKGERLTIWPLELKMLAVITLLGIIFTPIAVAPGDSISMLIDTFLKVGAIFVLMINLIDTRERLTALMKVAVICGTVMAIGAVIDYAAENYSAKGIRIVGWVGGLFGNANDLAASLTLLLPLAVYLGVKARGMARVAWFAVAPVLAAGVVATFSRMGFLSMVAVGAVLLWKLGRGKRVATALAFMLLLGVFLAAMPGGYGDRITSIFFTERDPTGSAQERRDLLERAVQVASNRLVIGVGMGNYHIYSLREKVAHNSYLEISAELGVAGLIAYLIMIFAPWRSLRRIERELRGVPFESYGGPKPWQEIYYLSIALQATFAGYLVCSFFGSIQYQWFIYYPIAYAVALRNIYQAERGEAEPSELPGKMIRKSEVGVLWEPYRAVRTGK